MTYIAEIPLVGINVRDDDNINFAKLICTGKKVIETRDSKSLHKYVGTRVRIIRTGKNMKAKIIGECTISNFKFYETKKEFDTDINLHLVGDNSNFKFKGYKVGYIIQNPILYPFSYKPIGFGIVARLNQTYPITDDVSIKSFKIMENKNFININKPL